MAAVNLDLQVADATSEVPATEQIRHWVGATLGAVAESRLALSIRVMDGDGIRRLNREFRGRDSETNVLSFPFEDIPGVETGYLGDIAICGGVVAREAREQGKTPEAHWAHMVIHGVLHLCGHDHVAEAEAAEMERIEVSVLGALGFDDPYAS